MLEERRPSTHTCPLILAGEEKRNESSIQLGNCEEVRRRTAGLAGAVQDGGTSSQWQNDLCPMDERGWG